MIHPLQAFWLRPRLLGSIGLMILLAGLLPITSLWMRLLSGWCLGVIVYVGLTLWKAAGQGRDDLRAEASRLDDSAFTISLFAILAAAASFAAVAMLVFGQREADGDRVLSVGLAALTMISAWIFVQVVFAVHYAHVYYGDTDEGRARGGLDFNGDDDPDVWDFLYFSVTIGATAQTSDTDITAKPIRRIVTMHTIYAYLYNTGVLALAINMAAGFIER